MEGELLVGNLSMLAALCGSGFVQVQSPSILCIEDVGEEPYRIHRYLMQLELSGLFAQTVAVIAGDFSRCLPSHGKGPAGEEVVKQYFRDKKIPLVTGAPFGHGDVNRPIPIGVPAQLSKQDGLLARMG